MIKPGCRVRIITDCRENGNATEMLGTYKGDFFFRDNTDSFENPKILLDNGDTIWGIECWWEEYVEGKTIEESTKEIHDFLNYDKVQRRENYESNI